MLKDKEPGEHRAERAPAAAEHQPQFSVENSGEPIHLTDVKLAGVATEAAAAGDKVKYWTRLALTSDDVMFHRIVEHLADSIESYASAAGKPVRVRSADTVVLVVKPDNRAELWVDAAAVAIQITAKRGIKAGTAVFERDIADVVGMSFPRVAIEAGDKVVCLFRRDWRFALYFDFNPDGDVDLQALTRTLGTLYRNLKYRHLYDALADRAVFDRLVRAGWFPFVEIVNVEFKNLLVCFEADVGISEAESELLARFDEKRLDQILSRWAAKPHFSSKMPLLEAAIGAFKNRDPVSVTKILLTEIEGILNNAYRNVHGRGAKIADLLKFAIKSAEHKTGQGDTLFFPAYFAEYLSKHTFADFDPSREDGSAGSRHAVGHGAARADSYTMVGALQAVLTLDQIAFFT